MNRDFLFELGVEEIPARFLPPLIEQLQQLTTQQLQASGLSFDSLRVLATPRRAALLISGLSEQAADTETEAKGPSLKAAYDENHQPTRALLGFCKSQGVEPQQLTEREVAGNRYVFAVKKNVGQPALALLPQLMTTVLDKLFFAKPMRWGANPIRFVRPIRWLVALYGEQVVELSYAGVQAGRYSRGHRFLGSDRIEISEAAAYLTCLRDNFVIVDQQERRAMIAAQIEAVAESINGCLHEQEELLDEVTYLLEYPTALCGRFEEKYLELPEQLVTTPMVDQQRYFPVYNAQGQLLPYFITVRNGDSRDLDIVASGNESVLKARLADAEFFYNEDLRLLLEHNVQKLDAVLFHEKLGSLGQKISRIVALAEFLAQQLGYEEAELRRVRRTAYLCKADLASHVVYEFPELQGIIGEYYALAAGEDEQVAQAIREHYLPRFAGDELPQTKAGIAVALADKIDSLAAFFAIGQIPSGSQDPFALRRAAAGCAQIIINNRLDLRLREVLPFAFDLLSKDVPGLDSGKMQERLDSVVSFFTQRLENILSESGVSYDVINAINKLSLKDSNLLAGFHRAHTLSEFRRSHDFHSLLAGFHRVANILRSAREKLGLPPELPAVQPELFVNDSERQLFTALLQAEQEVPPLVEQGDYYGALQALGKLTPPIDAFFTAVMVMDEDLTVRRNRLALLTRIAALTDDIADLSKIVE